MDRIDASRTSAPFDGSERLDALDRRLLDEFQRDFPVCPRPFAAIAEQVGADEQTVIDRFAALERDGYVGRIGPVFRPGRLGASTLAAMAVPPARLREVAEVVSAYPEVNHNYEREHRFNLWFVVAGRDQETVRRVLEDVGRRSGLAVLDLPLLEEFHIDLGFPLWQT